MPGTPSILSGYICWDSIAVIKHQDQKQLGEERVYLAYTSTLKFITEGSQDRNSNRLGNLEAGADAAAMDGGAAAYWLAQLLSCRTQGHQARDGTTHNGLGPPRPITN